MQRILAVISALFITFGGSVARAQDTGSPGAVVYGLASQQKQDGPSLVGADTVTVTVTGHVRLSGTIAGVYAATVSGDAATAVAAAGLRDAKLAKIRALAQQYAVQLVVCSQGFSLQIDPKAQSQRQREWAATVAGHDEGAVLPMQTDDLPKTFVALASLRLTSPAADQVPAFLDAIKTAGATDISDLYGPVQPNPFAQLLTANGYGASPDLDDAIWNAAGVDAVHRARIEAQALASAAGRSLNQAQQIGSGNRSVKNGYASVTVAVRFGLVPIKAP